MERDNNFVLFNYRKSSRFLEVKMMMEARRIIELVLCDLHPREQHAPCIPSRNKQIAIFKRITEKHLL